MLKLGRITKVKVLFLVLVFVFNLDLFKFSAAILEKGLFALKIFTQSMESMSPQWRCLLKLLTKRFLMFCVKNLSFLWNYCLS